MENANSLRVEVGGDSDFTESEWADARHIVSVSGGKDSTAMLLYLIERGLTNITCVFADTGNEHEYLHEYLDYLDGQLGHHMREGKVLRLEPDFTARFAKKLETVNTKWEPELTEYYQYTHYLKCKWCKDGIKPNPQYGKDSLLDEPEKIVCGDCGGLGYHRNEIVWHGVSEARAIELAKQRVAEASEILEAGPTGEHMLDLCIWKGRFPSRRAQFCTQHLKRELVQAVQIEAVEAGGEVVSWQGIRADESQERRKRPMWEEMPFDSDKTLFHYAARPILNWTAEQCFDTIKRHGLEHPQAVQAGLQ